MKFALRPYQTAAIAAVERDWEAGGLPPLLVMATGTGKTATALEIVHRAIQQRARVVWLAHREELLLQTLKAVRKNWPTVRAGIVQGSRSDDSAQLVIASVATVRSPERQAKILEYGNIGLIVVDEAHHSPSPTHTAAIEGLRSESTQLLGLTATPDREDGKPLSETWDIAYSYDIGSAVRDGYLLDPHAVVDQIKLDLEAMAEMDDEDLGAELMRRGIVDATVQRMRRTHHFSPMLDKGPEVIRDLSKAPALVFTASVAQAEATATALSEAGLTARAITGTTPTSDRRRILRLFEEGRIQVLCSPAVLTEGTDLPIAHLAVLARPFRSWSLYVQSVGRVLRPYEGQTIGMVLDLVGATDVHDLVAAPVLLGAEEENCEHKWLKNEKGPGGYCSECATEVRCFATLGGHEWSADPDKPRECIHCSAPQCVDSPDGWHAWVHTSASELACINCGNTRAELHAGILRQRDPVAVPRDAWIRLDGLTPKTHAADIEGHGLLLAQRDGEMVTCHWVPKRARSARIIGGGPLTRDMARRYCDELMRRAAKHSSRNKPSAPQERYCDRLGIVARQTAGETSRAISAEKARRRAIQLGVAVAT